MVKPLPAETWVCSLGWEDPLEKASATHQCSGASLVVQLVKNLPAIRETWVQSLDWKGYPLQYSGASLVAQLVKNLSAMWKTWVQFLGGEDFMEKGMATHSSILA